MRDFLDFMFGGRIGYIEMRFWKPDTTSVHRFWYPIDDSGFEDLILDARSLDCEGYEVYVDVVPRINDHAGTTEDVHAYTNLVWCDVDSKDFDATDLTHGKRLALDAMLNFPLAWNVIVDSGHGYHGYIRLDHLYLFDDVQPIMKGIAKRIGGDSVYDRARILRLPGLSNHKGGGNAPVRLIRFDTTSSFLLSDLAEFAYREPHPSHKVRITAKDWSRDRVIGSVFDDFDFDPGKGARSERDYAAVCRMIEANWSDAAIVSTFLDHPNGIGAKTAKNGLRYLERTIRKAHQAVGR